MRQHVLRVARTCFPRAPSSTLRSSTTRPRCLCTTRHGPPRTLTPGLLQRCSCRTSSGNTDTTAESPHWPVASPDYITDLLTPVANIPTRSSQRDARNRSLSILRTERRTAQSVAAHRACNQLPTELKLMRSSATAFERHLTYFTHCFIARRQIRCYQLVTLCNRGLYSFARRHTTK